jgi:hypothetical protein
LLDRLIHKNLPRNSQSKFSFWINNLVLHFKNACPLSGSAFAERDDFTQLSVFQNFVSFVVNISSTAVVEKRTGKNCALFAPLRQLCALCG